MELEELRQRIREWKQRAGGAPPAGMAPTADPMVEAYSSDVDGDGYAPVDEDGAAYVPVDEDGAAYAESADGAEGYAADYDDAVPVEMDEIESAQMVEVAASPMPVEELPYDSAPPPEAAGEVPSADAVDEAARLGIDLSVPEGESTAEIPVPGEDGSDPMAGQG